MGRLLGGVNCSTFRLIAELDSAFLKNKKEVLKVCLPALIYVLQNNLFYVALKHLDATSFSVMDFS